MIRNKKNKSQNSSNENCEFIMSVHLRRGKVIAYFNGTNGKKMSILSRGPSEIRSIVL